MGISVKSQGNIKSFDGTMLYYEKDKTGEKKAVIIIVHGFAEHLGRYEYITDKLNENGYCIYRYDNRGHGRSQGKRGHLNDFKNFIYDLDIIVDMAIEENPNIPIFILGHSMGGFITSAYGIMYKDKINGQILSGAATGINNKVKGIKGLFYKTLSYILPNIRIKVSVSDLMLHLSRDEKVIDKYIDDPLNIKDATLKFYVEFLINGAEWINKNIKDYRYPCLILHGGDDKIVSKMASENFHENISSKDKTIKVYDGLYHEIFNEAERDFIIDDVIKWIENRINNN